MTVYDVVIRLIGPIMPVGDSKIDDERFENLKTLTSLVDDLLSDIDAVIPHKERREYSMKRAGEFADSFYDRLGIQK